MWLLVICDGDGKWNIRREILILMLKVFRDALSILFSLREADVLGAMIAATTALFSMTFVDLSWSTPSKVLCKFSTRSTRLPFVVCFLTWVRGQYANTALLTMV